MRFRSLLLLVLGLGQTLAAQHGFYANGPYTFTEADTLRGMLRPERTCYDVGFYALDLDLDLERRYLSGHVDIHFTALSDMATMQIDLYDNMQLNAISLLGEAATWERRGHAIFVRLPQRIRAGAQAIVRVAYEGQPKAAANAPWDGGFVWEKDKAGKHWVGVACEGDGASLWWPCKDHLSDEPDSVSLQVAVPMDYMCVGNGDLVGGKVLPGGKFKWHWRTSYPINSYNVTLNVAQYVHFEDRYTAEDGETLRLDYYVLPYNLGKAQRQFQQVKPMLACFERHFGKYPFWRDGYALVETPYLGMEHQGAIAYGNQYMRGYLGGMLPKGIDFDYIIIHESGHEYFGNSLSCNDLAEMWIHESFTTYSEAVYVECQYGYEEALRYLRGQRLLISNSEPILGPKDVNWEDWQGSDHYFKGSWVLHTLRHAIGDDALWWDLLKSLHEDHKVSQVTTEDIVRHVNARTGKDFSAFFDQYLAYPGLPTLEYSLKKRGRDTEIRYRWQADAAGFDMPVALRVGGERVVIRPKSDWQESRLRKVRPEDVSVATDLFLIQTRRL